MSGHFVDFSAERWERAREVLAGEVGDCVSWRSAARAAGVPLSTLRGWVRRARERRDGDDPLLHGIADFVEDIDFHQSQALEDALWERAVVGAEEDVWHKGEVVGKRRVADSRLAMRLLEVRNERYRPTKVHEHSVRMDPGEVYQRIVAAHRLGEAREGLGGLPKAVDAEVVEAPVSVPVGSIEADVVDAPEDPDFVDAFVGSVYTDSVNL